MHRLNPADPCSKSLGVLGVDLLQQQWRDVPAASEERQSVLGNADVLIVRS